MILKSISLQNFRNYSKAEFEFNPKTTIIIGPNAIGKSNLIEAIYLLATGKSNRSEKQSQLIQFGKNIARVTGVVLSDLDDVTDMEVVLSVTGTNFFQRKYLVNGVAKRRPDYAGRVPVVEFSPLNLDIVAGQPSVRRRFLDEAIEAVDGEYRRAQIEYVKALRQRNALLHDAREVGSRDEGRFVYWDELLIKNGNLISEKREDFIAYINSRSKELFEFELTYDKSDISRARFDKYKNAEIASGVTLVGPHRDDVVIRSKNKFSNSVEETRYFGSRGQQRLVALELKLAQIGLIDKRTDIKPILLLDDVFSELDETNINLVVDLMDKYQTIATTTHREFIDHSKLKNRMKIIDLNTKR